MEIRNVIRFKTPLGFVTGMYVSDGEIRKLIVSHLLFPWNYTLVLYGYPLIQEFRFEITDSDFSEYLLFEHYYNS